MSLKYTLSSAVIATSFATLPAFASTPAPSAAPSSNAATSAAPATAPAASQPTPPQTAPQASEDPDDVRIKKLRRARELLEAEQALKAQEITVELARMENERRTIEAKLSLDGARLKEKTATLSAQEEGIAREMALELARRNLSLARIETESTLVDAKRAARKKVTSEVRYQNDPFHDGVLEITDRRIALNGVVTMSMADEVTEKLDFFNNQSRENPIFIVIDYSPGGSVMAGYRILQAMQASAAPVHVVVKSMAASMAAVIVTMADHSYAYPNAIILHHELSYGAGGNVTQQKERLAQAREWERRLHEPVAKKMGMSREQFVKAMYEHDSDGDWQEFGDEAKKIGWVENVVQRTREVGVVALSEPASDSSGAYATLAPTTAAELPKLLPLDHWFLFGVDDAPKKRE